VNRIKALGPLISVYASSSFKSGHITALALAGIIPSAGLLAYGIERFYFGYTHFGPAAGIAWSKLWLLSAPLPFGLMLLILTRFLWLGGRRIYLFENGIELRRFMPYATQSLVWDEIRGLATGMDRPKHADAQSTRHHAVLHLNSGRKINLHGSQHKRGKPGDIWELPDLLQRLRGNLSACLEPRLKSDFVAGRWVSFGAVSIHRHGLRIQNGVSRQLTISWNNIKRVAIRTGCLVVESKKDGALPHDIRVPISRIQNLELLLHMVEQEVKA
jgi:hypothetical protein